MSIIEHELVPDLRHFKSYSKSHLSAFLLLVISLLLSSSHAEIWVSRLSLGPQACIFALVPLVPTFLLLPLAQLLVSGPFFSSRVLFQLEPFRTLHADILCYSGELTQDVF